MNFLDYFFSQLSSHLLYISCSIFLVSSGTDEITGREEELDIVFDLSHVKGIPLEPVYQKDYVLNIVFILVVSIHKI